jgi:indole-3-glycerol phosphate synthase
MGPGWPREDTTKIETVTARKTILQEIIAHKRVELEAARRAIPETRLRELIEQRSVYADFGHAVGKPNPLGINLIAEVKKASPSKGVFRNEFDPVQIARAYERAGADAISVLTDQKYFQGSLEHLAAVRRGVLAPLLRKDFTVSAYHVLEAAAHGADAVLLIAAVLTRSQIEEFAAAAARLRLASVVEVYTEEELAVALEAGSRIIQINNRDLRTFRVDLRTTARLALKVPRDCVVISASGFDSADAVRAARDAGAHAVLVGESLVREADPEAKLRELRGG